MERKNPRPARPDDTLASSAEKCHRSLNWQAANWEALSGNRVYSINLTAVSPALLLTCAPQPCLPHSLTPSPITYWELGERARAQLASNITRRSTRCLRAHQGGGGERAGRAMSHGDARKTGAALGNARARTGHVLSEKSSGEKKEKEKTDSEMLRHLRRAAVPERRFVGGGKHIWRLAGNRSPRAFEVHTQTGSGMRMNC